MKTRLHNLLALLLLAFAVQVQASAPIAQSLHEFRTDGYRAATYLLIDNNLFERIRDPSNQESYNAALSSMQQQLQLMNDPAELRAPFNELTSLIRELENQSTEEAHYHLATINRIMMAHANLDKAAAALYATQAADLSETLQSLNQQSLDISQILLLYQNNMFSSIGVYFIEPGEKLFQNIDARIIGRSDTLKTLLPSMNTTLNELDKQYRFIQPRLINHMSDWVPSIAAFYLLRNVETLNDISRDQLRLSQAS